MSIPQKLKKIIKICKRYLKLESWPNLFCKNEYNQPKNKKVIEQYLTCGIFRLQTWHIAKYETIRYPASQILHCLKTNRWILFIFSNFDMDTFIMMCNEFQWYQKNSKYNLNNQSIDILLLISYYLYRYCDFEYLKISLFHWNSVYIMINVFIMKLDIINKIDR